MTGNCRFRVKENFRTFADLLETYTIEELQLLPDTQWIDISRDSVSITALPSQQRKYVKYHYNDRFIYDPRTKDDAQNQTKLYFEVRDMSLYPRTNMPWARPLFRFNLIGSRDFTDVAVDVIDAGKPLLHALLKKLAEVYSETGTAIAKYLEAEGEKVDEYENMEMADSNKGFISFTGKQNKELLDKINRYFNEEGLKTICFELDIDYDSLLGGGKSGKARELITQLNREGRIQELTKICQRDRSCISWSL